MAIATLAAPVRVVTVVGNRPQFVKAGAVSLRLRRRHEEALVHTGQHYDDELSRVFFEELDLPVPDRQLGVGSAAPATQTARMMEALEPVLMDLEPDLVLVYGDTNSTLAGAVAAAQAHVPVAHVEAGMRSFDHAMPEELNRVLTDHASELLLCSTQTAVDNLAREGVNEGVHLVGDTMADVALLMSDRAREGSRALEELGLDPGCYLVATAHRAGNVDDPRRLERLVDVLLALPRPLVFPVHPRTRARLDAAGLWERLDGAKGLHAIRPVGYLDMLALAASSRAVVTDSGGLQKEAYLLGVPCVTLRDRTEWVETVEVGWNTLVDLDSSAALAALERATPEARPELYGGGRAGERICDVIDGYAGSRSAAAVAGAG
jgi:UDP-N-acetylglucosamine 2-epimerase (non-hydrolysing)/UDP-GlcNAc3NAcA epimerase